MPEAPARTARAEVLVDLGLCKACGICIALCPAQVFDRDADGRAVVARLADCTVCRICEWHCPDLAIEVLVGSTPADETTVAEDDADGAPAPGTAAAQREP